MEEAKLAWASAWLAKRKVSYFEGKWQSGTQSPVITSINPATAAPIGTFQETAGEQIEQAVASARRAFEQPSWSRLPRRDRARLLERVADCIRRHHAELATLESLDNGKLYRESFEDDIPEAADVFDYYAGWADKLYGETCPVDSSFLCYTQRSPVGVCALIVPWNFPLLMAAWKLAPALAMGNTVVLKPAPATSFTAIRLFEILHEAAIFPEGVINLVLGGPAVGEALTRHPGVNKVAFTGSTAVGRQVVHGSADSNLKTLSLELGGKSANIVFDDAPEVDFAIERSFTAMFSHKGEKCSEPTRLFVQEKLYRRFVDEFAARADKVVCGDPFLPGSQQGPQCTLEQFEKALRYIEIGKKEGARLVSGGTADRSPGNEKGYYVRPTVFADVGNRMRIAQEEIFGPVLVILPFRTEDEAVAMANDSPYGLAAGLWSADVSRAHRVAARLEAGMVFVNRYGCYDFSAPFGGWKQSGWGKEMALHSLDAYTRLKSVWIKI